MKYGAEKVFLPSCLLMLVSFILLAFSNTIPLILLSAVLFGLGNGVAFPTVNVILMELCPVERRGAANGTMFASMDIGMALGGFLWGFLADKLGFSMVYILAGIVIIITQISFKLLCGDKSDKEKAVLFQAHNKAL